MDEAIKLRLLREQITMEEILCQSCAIPMDSMGEMYGTNTDGSKSKDYCNFCFENGAFTTDCTMDVMIEIRIFNMKSSDSSMSAYEARKMFGEFFPTLKRWKTASR